MSDDAKPSAVDGIETEGSTAYISRIDRRTALIWMSSVGVVIGGSGVGSPVAAMARETNEEVKAKGYGTDPKLNPPAKAAWPRILTRNELTTAAFVCDVILPASGQAPAASAVGVPDFIDEWVSAPYPAQVNDRALICEGLRALSADVLAGEPNRARALMALLTSTDSKTRAFFKRFRALTIGAYYTTEAGFRDIGYIGNVARASDPGPSDAVKASLEVRLKQLGLPG